MPHPRTSESTAQIFRAQRELEAEVSALNSGALRKVLRNHFHSAKSLRS